MPDVYLGRNNTFASQSSVNKYSVDAFRRLIRVGGLQALSDCGENIYVQQAGENILIQNGHKRVRAMLEEMGGGVVNVEIVGQITSVGNNPRLIDIRKTLF